MGFLLINNPSYKFSLPLEYNFIIFLGTAMDFFLLLCV
jgi:hypothetical protein